MYFIRAISFNAFVCCLLNLLNQNYVKNLNKPYLALSSPRRGRGFSACCRHASNFSEWTELLDFS